MRSPKNTRPTKNKLTQRDQPLYKTRTALTCHSRRSRSAGISGHLRPESSVILSGIRRNAAMQRNMTAITLFVIGEKQVPGWIMPIRLTHRPTTGSVWWPWRCTAQRRFLNFSECFPMRGRALPILRQFGGRTVFRARPAAFAMRLNGWRRGHGCFGVGTVAMRFR